MKTLRAGVIGLGVGEQHIRGFAAHPDAAVLALCDRDSGKRDMARAKYPAARVYEVAEALIDDPEINVVSIATYDNEHYDYVIRALRAGKHVFVEKPMCLEADELVAIRRELAAHPGIRLSTNTVLRQSPRFRWLKQAIAEGQLGTPYLVEADYVYGRLEKLTEGWRGRSPGYSVMLGGGVHMVDLLLWLMEERPIEAFALANDTCSAGSPFSGNDMTIALLRFAGGLVAKVSANFGSVHPHFHRLLVYGTRGTFENPPEAPGIPARLWTSRSTDRPPSQVDAAYPGVAKSDLIESFLEGILGRGTPQVAEDDVFASLSVCLAIDQSVQRKQPVAIKYV